MPCVCMTHPVAWDTCTCVCVQHSQSARALSLSLSFMWSSPPACMGAWRPRPPGLGALGHSPVEPVLLPDWAQPALQGLQGPPPRIPLLLVALQLLPVRVDIGGGAKLHVALNEGADGPWGQVGSTLALVASGVVRGEVHKSDRVAMSLQDEAHEAAKRRAPMLGVSVRQAKDERVTAPPNLLHQHPGTGLQNRGGGSGD